MEILVLTGSVMIITMMWVSVALVITEIRQRQKDRAFSAKLRRLSNTTYSIGDSGAVVRYDSSIDYPSNIIEIKGKKSC